MASMFKGLIIINSELQFLAASPDGFVDNNSLVEVKCPASAKDMTPLKGIERKKITFMHLQNGVSKLEDYNNYMFQVQGLGLGDAKDITIKGLEIIKNCSHVYLESYTSILSVDKKTLEDFYGCSLIVADRDMVESDADSILSNVENEDIAFLVVGDPFGATTHTDLVLRAQEKGAKVKVVHNTSILSAVGCCGLQLYSFGETISIPYWTETWQPDSFYDKIASNRQRGLHTLCLLDIKVKEPTLESILSKKKIYMPPKFMSVAEASSQLSSILEKRRNADDESIAFTDRSLVVGLARIGSDDQDIIACSLQEMKEVDLGKPLHSLIVPAEKLHPLEISFLRQYALNKGKFDESVTH